MKNTLVTGGTGFVGANLVFRLLNLGHAVHLVVRPGHNPWRLAPVRDDLTCHTVDLRDRDSLGKVLRRVRPDWVFHLAANGAYSWQRDIRQMLADNVTGTVNLVEACLETGFEALVNTGSSSEYGPGRDVPGEDSWLDPGSHYAVTKAFGTQYCRFAAIQNRVKITTLRLYSVYGPMEEPGRFIPSLMVHGLQGDLPPLASPDMAHDFVFVDDAVEACLRVAASGSIEPGCVFNVGCGIQTSIHEAVTIARQIMDIPAEPRWQTFPDRPWDTRTWRANTGKIRKTLGWFPAVDFKTGLIATLNWFKDNPQIWGRYINGRGNAR